MKNLVGLVSVLALCFAGCASPTDAEPSAQGEQDLGFGAPSGVDACPGLGWWQPVDNWFGLGGFFLRANGAPQGEMTMLKVFEDPNPFDGGSPGYVRRVNDVEQRGRVLPRQGAVLDFLDERGHSRDLYATVAQQRGAILSDLVGICLVKADGSGRPAAGAKPFMLHK